MIGMMLLAAATAAGVPKTVQVTVDPSVVKAEVPRTLYGTGMEDVNHEIYGGLDAQRLYDESFEETLPPQVHPLCKTGSGKKAAGRQWEDVLSDGGTVCQDEQVKHLGARSQLLEPNGGTAGVANRGLNGWGVPCREGKRLLGHFFAKGAVDRLEVALQRGDGRRTYATNVVTLVAGDGWRRVDFALVPDTTDPQGRFVIRASGKGRLWIDDAYLADEPTNEFGRLGCREDLVAAFRREELTFLRWGGTMVNTPEYSLKNCRDDRRPYAGFWFRTSSTGFHVREFVRMAAAMKLPCAFSIYTYEETDEAVKLAAWLKQFDIALYVSIGNEELTGWGDAMGAKCDLESCRRYGESLRRIVTAMKAVNPKLKFVNEVMWDGKRMDIMEEAFRQTDGYADYWDIHVGAWKVTSGWDTAWTLGKFREMVTRLNPKSTMKAAIFEENSYIHDMRRALAHAANLEAAREMGDFLLTSCPANALQAYQQNDNGWDQGQIFYTTDKAWLQPCGWAQQMASANHRDLLVEGKTDEREVSVSATCDRDRQSVVLHFINRTAEPRRIDLTLKGAPRRVVKATSLSAPRLEDRNPPDDSERISPRDVTAEFVGAPLLKPYSYTVVELR